MRINKTLTALDLGDTRLGEEAGLAFGEALRKNKTLTRLSLAGCKLGSDGGSNLSSGSRQLLMLARAMLSSARILVMQTKRARSLAGRRAAVPTRATSWRTRHG